MSRIHVSIGYDPLDDKAREQIWDALFRKLKDDYKSGGPEFKYEWEAKRYVQKSDDVKELQLNGREIRNGVFGLLPNISNLLTNYSLPNSRGSCSFRFTEG